MALDTLLNFGKVTVSTGYGSTDTTIVLSSGDGSKLPAPATDGEFNLVWWNSTDYSDTADDPSVEIVRVTARSSDTLTVTRAQESTTATTKNTSGKTYKMMLCFTKKTYDDLVAGLAQVETPTGTVDGSNLTFTVNNEPKFIVVDGLIRFENNGYTYSGGTITVDALQPPVNYIRSIH